jgi:hypothetical protein
MPPILIYDTLSIFFEAHELNKKICVMEEEISAAKKNPTTESN